MAWQYAVVDLHWEVRFLRSLPVQVRALEGALTWLRWSFSSMLARGCSFASLRYAQVPVAIVINGRIWIMNIAFGSQEVSFMYRRVTDMRGCGNRVWRVLGRQLG